jgi:hypothetical protein
MKSKRECGDDNTVASKRLCQELDREPDFQSDLESMKNFTKNATTVVYYAADKTMTVVALEQVVWYCWNHPIESLIVVVELGPVTVVYMITGALADATLNLIDSCTDIDMKTTQSQAMMVNTTLALFVTTLELSVRVQKLVADWYLI